MQKLALFLTPVAALLAHPATAQTIAYGDIAELIRFGDSAGENAGIRLVATPRPAPVRRQAVAYGPFRVVDDTRAVMSGATDSRSPAAFQAMLRDFPNIAVLEMARCPGTYDDQANLRLGRMIRAKGLATYVPEGGYVASGAVELFIAGVRRYAEPSAKFAVHSWEDYRGREPGDLPMNAPQNRAYLDYYGAMGMSEAHARAFYTMTNSTPFERARWLTSGEMAQWVSYDPPKRPRGAFARFGRAGVPVSVASSAAPANFLWGRP